MFVNTIFTQLGKVMVGRLRPHFLAVCKPNYSLFNCSDGFITADYCTGLPKEIKEARLVLVYDVLLWNKGRFCNNSKIDKPISKRLSIGNKAKLFQLTRADFATIAKLTNQFQSGCL